MEKDEELLERIGRRDADAFEYLYAKYRGQVLLQVRRMVRDVDAAEDLVQETFLRVWQKSDQWRGLGSVAAWIRKIALNLTLSYIDVVRRSRTVETKAYGEQTDEELLTRLADEASLGPDALYLRSEKLRRFKESLGELSEQKREVIRAFLDEDVTWREVSERLDLPLGTVKSRVHYALQDLRKMLEEEQ